MATRRNKPPNKSEKNQYLQVFVRCRPLSDSEAHHQRNTSAVDINGQKEIAIQDRCNSKVTKTYAFDKIFTPDSTQADVYQNVVAPLISDVLCGYNCTVFAYGQTGSGKTFTMEGDLGTSSAQVFSQHSNAGLIPRAMCALFDELRILQSEYTVRISLIELYNEELYDLLSPDEVPPKLRLFEDSARKGSVLVQGLQEVMVHTQLQVLDELRKGSAKRQVAATQMNAQSSRSHTIFCVTVHYKESSIDGEELMRTGKLNLVDLAGSENIGRSGSVDKRAREAASINQSLLTLSRVTACLVEHQPHVPYRESKLTRLLQDSLGGRTKTSLIATISPAQSNVEETLSTLDYAHRAKSVANRPEINQKVAQNVIMKEYMDIIEGLKKKLELHRTGSGVYVNHENYQGVVQQRKEKELKIADITAEFRAVLQAMTSTKENFKAMSSTLEIQKNNLENVNKTIEQTEGKIAVAQEVLMKCSAEQEQAKNVFKTLFDQESELRTQANHLSNVVESAHSDCEKIHNRLDFSRVVLVENAVVLNNLADKSQFFSEATKKMRHSLCAASDALTQLLSAIGEVENYSKKERDSLCESIVQYFQKLNMHLENFCATTSAVPQQQETHNSESKENRATFCLQMEQHLECMEQSLRDLCQDYYQLIYQLPLKCTSLVTFCNTIFEDMKSDKQVQFDDYNKKLDIICAEIDQRTSDTYTLQKDLHLKKNDPIDCMHKQVQLVGERTSTVRAVCNKSEQLAAHLRHLFASREEIVKQTLQIKEQVRSPRKYLTLRDSEMLSNRKTFMDSFVASNATLVYGRKNQTDSILHVGREVAEIEKRVTVAMEKFRGFDYVDPTNELVEQSQEFLQQTAITLNSEATLMDDLAHHTREFQHSLSSKFEEMKGKQEWYKQKEQESFGILLDTVQSTTLGMMEHLDEGKAMVNELVSSAISHDVQTGQTPVRKSYGSIPKLASLSTPVRKRAELRIKRAPWKRLLRSPRKPLTSCASLQDEDECMASDSEVTYLKKKEVDFNHLQKTSSLSDLRSKGFPRPRIPKKFARKVL